MKKKIEVLRLRVTAEEKEIILKKAEKNELKFSDYARKMLMNEHIIFLPREELLNLARIGINLNQIAKVANYNRAISEQENQKIIERTEELQEVIKRLRKLVIIKE